MHLPFHSVGLSCVILDRLEQAAQEAEGEMEFRMQDVI